MKFDGSIEGAEVNNGTKSANTNSNGYYTFYGVSPGSYTITVEKEWYDENSNSVNVTAGVTSTKNFSLVPYGSIEGRITDEKTGVGANGALFSCGGGGSNSIADDYGHYLIEKIRPGNYSVTASRNFYKTRSSSVTAVAKQIVTADFSINPDKYTRISLAQGGTEANGDSGTPSISTDGQYIAFSSDASNLVTGDTNNVQDIFLRNQQTGQTQRFSVASDGAESNGYSGYPSISDNGRYVIFYSLASNIVFGDTNGTSDVFVHDLQTGQTTRVSVASDGTQANGFSHLSDFAGLSFNGRNISADGRYLVFSSDASNLVDGDLNNASDIFRHDCITGETILIPTATPFPPFLPIGGDSSGASISADGRYVAFVSHAINLVPSDTNGTADIFRYDCQTGTTIRVSVASDGTEACSSQMWKPVISPDGRYVAFWSDANNLVPSDTNGSGDIFRHDCQTGETILVTTGSSGQNVGNVNLNFSSDNRYIIFAAFGILFPGLSGDAFIYDSQTGQIDMAVVGSEGAVASDSRCDRIVMSSDNRYYIFPTSESISAGDLNSKIDIYIRDLW